MLDAAPRYLFILDIIFTDHHFFFILADQKSEIKYFGVVLIIVVRPQAYFSF